MLFEMSANETTIKT